MITAEITRRPVLPFDRPFLLELYASVRKPELDLTPWTPQQKNAFVEMQFDAQSASYAQSYPDGVHEIVCESGRPVGRLYRASLPDRLHILDLSIVPGRRNSGIGSFVLRQLLAGADSGRKPVTIYLENFNPCLGLFQRLGFRISVEDGFLLLLERPAST